MDREDGGSETNSELVSAAERGDLSAVERLLEEGASVEDRDDSGRMALVAVAYENHLEVARKLIEAGADVESLDSYNGTGLIRASERGYAEIVKELLNTDIDVDHVNNLEWTALLEAIILGDGGSQHTEVVRLLVDSGADVNLADGDGVTPLEHARKSDYKEIVQILEDAGAK